LVAALSPEFYVDEERVASAVRRRASFNIIHLATLIKVDLFVLKDDPLSRQEMERRQHLTLPGPEGWELPVATARTRSFKSSHQSDRTHRGTYWSQDLPAGFPS